MARSAFEIHTSEPVSRAIALSRDAVVGAGYREGPVAGGRAAFLRPGPIGGVAHRVFVSVRERAGGATVTVEVVAPIGTLPDQMAAIRRTVEGLLRPALGVWELADGVVSSDGRGVVFSSGMTGIPVGPTPNRLSDRSSAAKVVFAVGAAFFLGLAFLYVLLAATRQVEDRSLPFILGVFCFFGGLSLVGLLRARYGRRLPASLLASFDGIELGYDARPAQRIPWEAFSRVTRAPSSPEWRMSFRDGLGRERWVSVTADVAAEVRAAHALHIESAKARAGPVFEAFNLAPPGTRVFVSDRPLTEDELRYRKLSKRWLPAGPVGVPVYVSLAEDARIVRDLVARSRPSAEHLRQLAFTAIQAEAWGLGADLLAQTLPAMPEDEEIAYNLGGCLLKSGRLDEALRVVDEFIVRHPLSSRCHTMRALLVMKMQQPEEALHHIGRAAELDPNNAEALNVWFDVVSGEGGVGQAIAELDYFAGQHPTAWGPRVVLGERLLAAGQNQEAVERMEEAHRIEANNDTLYGLTNALIAQQRVDEAFRLLEASDRHRKPGPGLLMNLAVCYALRGDRNRAFETLDRVELSGGPRWVAAAGNLRRRMLDAR